MAPSPRLKSLNPQRLWMLMTISGLALLLVATASGIYLALKQNQQLVENENRMMLRRNGELLINQNIRGFVETLGLDERDYLLTIESELDHKENKFGKLAKSQLSQCSTDYYFQFRVELCRPPPISWPTILSIFVAFLALIAIVAALVRRLGVEIVNSFQDLFRAAKIKAPAEMNFTQAWSTAFSMAQNFKDFQTQLLEAEKNRAIVDLSRQVAHDIRSPLTALNFLVASLDDIHQEKKDFAKLAIRRIEGIADELLKKSKYELPRPPIDLVKVIGDLLQEKKLEYKDRALEFHCQLAEAHSDLSEIEFQRLLSNLINNSIEAQSTLVKVTLREIQNQFELIIEDNGAGIAPEILKRVGEANFTSRESGNGLGVHHAKNYIESVGGTLQIKSTQEKGTQITILIPNPTHPN